jgi:hypothetical protein
MSRNARNKPRFNRQFRLRSTEQSSKILKAAPRIPPPSPAKTKVKIATLALRNFFKSSTPPFFVPPYPAIKN